ncbi:SDR family NAD(P)-dependent oxidoreductase [Pedobacter hartonius]|uniref:NAD(P)-dependent dehydrogenase, short-chain alcohol dehydrogenase family n=1 Tax=Pedobacter hartonius TaxID=425514 RepID=A0A1H4GFJ6_9SPHI|nr:SDR family NAD(P)-dependent oxidoreductase [Pedobacter hartonius]SEB08376.1 NAD(P)-dependent dehydrogenase, short-chain alcohol dehydrogenase family [Pedobacter hartonius]
MKSIIITGANSGIGFECALQLANTAKDAQIILACRNEQTGEEAVKKIKHKTGHRNLVCRPLNLASLKSIKQFTIDFAKSPDPVISALINHAGGLFMGKTSYTTDGFEMTFGTNHLGGFYLTLLLLPFIEVGGSITFTSSGVHDPANHTGIAPPVFTSGKELAFPETTNGAGMAVAQKRYSTSKLCNVLTAYILHEKLAGKKIRVNAFDPGKVPGTGFLRTLPTPLRLIASQLAHLFLLFGKKDTFSAATSGKRLATLAYSKELERLNGIYFKRGQVTNSSADSYNPAFQAELWKSSIELTGLKQEETNLNLEEQ